MDADEELNKLVDGLLETSFTYIDELFNINTRANNLESAQFILNLACSFAVNCIAVAVATNGISNHNDLIKQLLASIERRTFEQLAVLKPEYS